MQIKKILSIPKSSIPRMIDATGVLLAPANIATRPIPANSAIGRGTNQINTFPSVAPIKNNGVTSPPLNPAPIVNEVNRIFKRKSYEYYGQ